MTNTPTNAPSALPPHCHKCGSSGLVSTGSYSSGGFAYCDCVFGERARVPSPAPECGGPRPVGQEKSVPITTASGKIACADESIAGLVQALNNAGFETVASCSGHTHRPSVIALRDGRELIIARNYEEARAIDRLFPRDINGDGAPECDGVPPVLCQGCRQPLPMNGPYYMPCQCQTPPTEAEGE